jgi:hypothetical protein
VGFVEYFGWLARQVFDALMYFWPITLGLVIAIVFFSFKANEKVRQFAKANWGLLTLPILIAVAILVFGTVYRKPDLSVATIPSVKVAVLSVMLAIQFAAGAFLVAKAKGQRLLSLSMVGFFGWLSLCCFSLSCMSVTGNWI